MRLWHHKLIPVLPRKQLVSQWRELWAILRNIQLKGKPGHVLVDRILNYSTVHLAYYSSLVYDELLNRGYNPSRKLYEFLDLLNQHYPKLPGVPVKFGGTLFDGWHNDRYLNQCYFNLQEKRDCGAITDEEWEKIQGLTLPLLQNYLTSSDK